MKLFKQIPFDHDGKYYDIRIMYDQKTINVAAFSNNYPANGFRYQVLIPKGCDGERVLNEYPADDLVEKCKQDLMQNNWDMIDQKIKTIQLSNH